jgi:hypothetical protein
LAQATAAQEGTAQAALMAATGAASTATQLPEPTAAEMSAITAKRERMKRFLAAGPHEVVYLPLPGPDNDRESVPVQVNGYKVLVPRGEQVNVPVPIADLLRQSGHLFGYHAGGRPRTEPSKDGFDG